MVIYGLHKNRILRGLLLTTLVVITFKRLYLKEEFRFKSIINNFKSLNLSTGFRLDNDLSRISLNCFILFTVPRLWVFFKDKDL